MKDIIASSVNPATNENLLQDLKEPEYLIELIQNWFQTNYGYNLDGKWDRTTPEDYKLVMNKQLRDIEDAIWKAIIKAESTVAQFRDLHFHHEANHEHYLIAEGDDYVDNAHCCGHDRF